MTPAEEAVMFEMLQRIFPFPYRIDKTDDGRVFAERVHQDPTDPLFPRVEARVGLFTFYTMGLQKDTPMVGRAFDQELKFGALEFARLLEEEARKLRERVQEYL